MIYFAIIGDIKSSKNIVDRNEAQKKLTITLNYVNEKYSEDIAAKFLITLGDEFQGLLINSNHLLEIINYIQREMHPIKIRFGVGLGEILTEINRDAAIGADGPAFYAARNMIEDIKKQERTLKNQATDIQIAFYDKDSFEISEINTMLMLLKVIENNWSEKQRYTIWDMLNNGGSQESCAKRMNTSQSTVARRLAHGNFIIYEKTKAIINAAINTLGDME